MNDDDDQDLVAQILAYGYCDCRNWVGGKMCATEGHTCPYKEEINGDYISLCNCCSVCQSTCADGI